MHLQNRLKEKWKEKHFKSNSIFFFSYFLHWYTNLFHSSLCRASCGQQFVPSNWSRLPRKWHLEALFPTGFLQPTATKTLKTCQHSALARCLEDNGSLEPDSLDLELHVLPLEILLVRGILLFDFFRHGEIQYRF